MSSARRQLVAYVTIAISFVMAGIHQYGPARGEPLEHMWQVWNPLYIQLLGLAVLPLMWVYLLPLASALGGRRSGFGRFVWYTAAGSVAFFGPGLVLNFLYETCPLWLDSCTNEVGVVPAPSFEDLGYLAMFPLTSIGLVSLLRGLGGSVRESLRRLWFVPLGGAIIMAVLLLPFALDVGNASDQNVLETIIEHAYAIGLIVLLTLSVSIEQHVRRGGGGPLFRPVLIMNLGLLIVAAGMIVRTHTINGSRTFDPTDPTVSIFTAGFIAWIVGSALLGRALTKASEAAATSPASSS